MESHNLKFLVEKNIPFVSGLLEPYGDVTYLKADEFSPESVKDADALLVRTRTRCDESLLRGSKVSFIGTATIGTDHIDLPWCKSSDITVANAPGCNAPAVAQYVLASIIGLCGPSLQGHTLGIVGVGNVGTIVADWAQQLGMEVLLNDPPRQQAEGGTFWSTLDDIAERCDIITLHPSLNQSSRHIVNTEFIDTLRKTPIIINAARGPIVDTAALIDGLDRGKVREAVIDTWEDEPSISPALLDRAVIATPHIAGYSYEGKVRATRMVLDALCTHFGLPRIDMPETVAAGACATVTASAIAASYNPMADTRALKSDPSAFESLRNHYALRHEVGL